MVLLSVSPGTSVGRLRVSSFFEPWLVCLSAAKSWVLAEGFPRGAPLPDRRRQKQHLLTACAQVIIRLKNWSRWLEASSNWPLDVDDVDDDDDAGADVPGFWNRREVRSVTTSSLSSAEMNQTDNSQTDKLATVIVVLAVTQHSTHYRWPQRCPSHQSSLYMLTYHFIIDKTK